MSTLLDLVEHFQSISGVSIEKHLLATPSDVNVKAAFRTFDIAVTGKGWDVIKAEVEKNTQNLFDDCDSMIFDGLPLETSEPYTPRQVFIAVIYAVLVVNGKNGVPSSLNSLLVEIHKTTRDLRGLPSRERRLDLVIGQLFQRIITILAYAQSKPSSRFSLSSRAGYDLVHHPDVQEQLRHIRWLVDDLQWGFGDFAAVFTQKFPSPLPLNNYPWPRSEFLHQTKVRLRELHGLPRGEGEAKRFQAAFGRLMEVIDGLVPRLDEFEERIIGSTYHEVDCLLQAAKETGSSRELASNVLCEISRCLCKFSHAPNTPKNKIAFARSIVVTLHVLRMLPSTIRNHAARLTVVSAMSKISVLNIEEKLSLNHEGVASLIGDLRSLTVRLDSGENDKGQVFTSMWEEALKKYKSLTSTDLGALANASGAETIEDLQKAVDKNQYTSIRNRAKGSEVRQALQPVLGFLQSFTGAIGEAGAYGGFFPSKAIAGSVKAVFDASQEIRNSNDMAMDLFKDLSSFLVRVKIHTHSQNNTVPELKLELTEILCQFLIVMGTAYSTVKRSRLKRLAKYLARTPDSIVEQVREFKRICSNLDRLLLSLIFEATYSPVYQHHHPSPLHTPAEAGPSTSNRFPLSKDRDDTLVAPPASPKYRSTVTEGTSGESLDGSSPEMLPLVQSPKSMAPSHAVSSPADSELSTTVGRSLSPVVQPVQSTPGVHGNVRAYSTAAGLKILCLDGGGVRGLIEILVLEEILERLAFDLNRDLKPCDVFDIIVGTGTGGLVAVLFGRLGLSIQQAVDVYCDIFRAVADEDTVDKKTRRFEKKVKEIVERFTKNSETKMFSADSPSKTILCAMPAHNLPHLRIFRSYRARTNQCIDCAIWEATRATTTMPSIFSDIEIARGFQHDLFVDGGLRCHNPTMELMKELEDNFRDSELACIVSIGAGKPAVASPDYAASSSQSSMDKTLLAVAIDCEKTAEAASKHFEAAREKGAGGSVPYWRFNTEPGIQGNVEWNRISEMVSHVKSYLAGSSVQRDVDELVETLAKHPRLVDSGLHR